VALGGRGKFIVCRCQGRFGLQTSPTYMDLNGQKALKPYLPWSLCLPNWIDPIYCRAVQAAKATSVVDAVIFRYQKLFKVCLFTRSFKFSNLTTMSSTKPEKPLLAPNTLDIVTYKGTVKLVVKTHAGTVPINNILPFTRKTWQM
jgi:hypothetical protein